MWDLAHWAFSPMVCRAWTTSESGFPLVQKTQNWRLFGGVNPSENINQLGWLFPIYGEKNMFQTTNQKV